MENSVLVKTPWWFWAVSVFAVLWTLMGLNDYYNSVTLNVKYLSQMDGMIEFMQAMPVWAKGAWGLAIGSAFLASVLMLLRKKLAVPIYIIALLAMFVSFGYQFSASNGPDVPNWVHAFTALIWAIAFFLTWFSRAMLKRGILR
jgi:hypothetical protein